MALKDLGAYLDPALELPLGGKTYTVQPPSKDAGLKLAAINAAGVAAYASLHEACPTCGRAGTAELPEDTRALLTSIAETELGELSLGASVLAEMTADGVPGPHIDKAALYAMYFWTLGEATADAIFEAQYGAEGDASGEASGPSTSPRGPRTASGNRTQRRASTRATPASRRG